MTDRDPPTEPAGVPTMFEWCGGYPALLRMTRLFYERYVPQDPVLSPTFAAMASDHPERVAKWLGEVFGGPKSYSEAFGGYPRMLSQHLGRAITEEQRQRWVSLLLRSSTDAGLPDDPEFRSAFRAYIEWGSRLAVENSQPGAQPPAQLPMPHWDWNTAAGPPGSRVPASRPDEPLEHAVVLPALDEPVQFEKHIKPLFRVADRQSMSFAFDLWGLEDVRKHAEVIYGRLAGGSMPCDGAWDPGRIDAFRRWIDTGMSP